MRTFLRMLSFIFLAGTFGAPHMAAAQSGMVTTTAQPMNKAEKEFVKQMAQMNGAQIQQGRAAIQKATNPDVKAFGARMVADHAVANQQLTQIAAAQGVKLPSELTKEATAASKSLQGKMGNSFDKAFMTLQVIDHEKTLDKLAVEAAKTSNAQLKTWTQQQIPILREHLQQARQLNDQLRAQIGATS